MPAAAKILPVFLESLSDGRFSPSDMRRINKVAVLFMENPSHPGISYERLRKTRDRNFWSARVTDGIRIIIYRTDATYILCFAGRHDDAYRWAENKSVGFQAENAIQLLDIIQDDKQPPSDRPADAEPNYADENTKVSSDQLKDEDEAPPGEIIKNFVFKKFSDEDLSCFGVPELNVKDLREIGSEEELLELAISKGFGDDLFDNLAGVFQGFKPLVSEKGAEYEKPPLRPEPVAQKIYPLAELEDNEALISAMQQPWDKWLVFIDPEQKSCIRGSYKGPAKVFGSAGTGKTVVALHRAAYLAGQQKEGEKRIYLLTFSKTLATDLKEKLELLVGSDTPLSSKIHVSDFETFALTKYSELNPGSPARLAGTPMTMRAANLAVTDLKLPPEFSPDFIHNEYVTVVGPWGLRNLDDYLRFQRQGSGKQLGPGGRKNLWPAFEYINNYMEERNRITKFELFRSVSEHLETGSLKPADHVVIDECQDIGPEILRMIRAMVPEKDNDLFLCGDLGQSLYRRHHSWLQHGIDIRGRSSVLRINYRTSRQIKDTADCLTELQADGADGIREDRRAVSTFNGPEPVIRLYKNEEDEAAGLAEWLTRQIEEEGAAPHELLIISRTSDYYRRAKSAADLAGLGIWQLDAENNWHHGLLGFSSTERSKGLEYKGVAVIACDADAMPLARRIETAENTEEKNEMIEIEKNQLYVAITRARDSLYISGRRPGSQFLDELSKGKNPS